MKKAILAILAVGLMAAQAYAFTGTIGFSGTMSQKTKKGVTTDTFKTNWLTQGGNTGDYSGVGAGVSTAMTNFSFTGNNTLTPALVGAVIPQWKFTIGTVTYSFNLEVLTSAFSSSTGIAESGTGTAFIGGQSSVATWSLDGAGGKFTFSASIHTSAIPDGGSALALLGIALAGIEGARRLISARKA